MFITSGGYRAKALTRRICITIKSFFVPRSQQDRKHLFTKLKTYHVSCSIYISIASLVSYCLLYFPRLKHLILGQYLGNSPPAPPLNPTLTLTCYQLTAEGLGER